MRLPEEDENYLRAKGYKCEFVDSGGEGWLVIKDFPLAPGKYDHTVVDVLIQFPIGYNNAKLDMFYVVPAVRLKSNGQYPHRAESMENHAGRACQRFSRHLPTWRPGIDRLQNFMQHVLRELQEKQ
jgi:hypothetical protein